MTAGRASRIGMAGLVLGLTYLAVVVTLSAAYVATHPPRSFVFWTSTGLACSIELLAGMWILNGYARFRSDTRPSGAAMSIVFGILAVYTLSVFITVVAFALLRAPYGLYDGLLAGTLALETAFFFIAAAAFYAHDLAMQETIEPLNDKRAQHAQQAASVRELARLLEGFHCSDYEQQRRVARLVKRWDALASSISHSHGGGIGSWEQGGRPLAGYELEIEESLRWLSMIAQHLKESTPAELAQDLDKLERATADLAAEVQNAGLA